jgi:microsomal dipeptidase-like Zn-dependent dipeptidase
MNDLGLAIDLSHASDRTRIETAAVSTAPLLITHACADLVGLDHVGFGPDTLYGDHVGLHRTFASLLGHSANAGPEHPRRGLRRRS